MRKLFVSFALIFLASGLPAQSLLSRDTLLERITSSFPDTDDDIVLRRTLYGTLRPDEISLEQAGLMVAAAQRRYDRLKDRIDEVKPLIEQGIYARNELKPLEEELEFRKRTLDLARSRAKFLEDLAEMARVEQAFQDMADDPADSTEPRPLREKFEGSGVFTQSQFRQIVLAYEKQFSEPFPVSANGETAVHKALGFDHRGRVDVALNPDTPEGVWLRQFLASQRIPYYAFRRAVPGKATAAHIHIGPPSLRLRVAD